MSDYYTTDLPAHRQHEKEHDMELRQAAIDMAVEEMVETLARGETVTFGQGLYHTDNGVVKVYTRTLTADDVRDEIDGDLLRQAVLADRSALGRELWLAAARRLCQRHAEDYLEWRAMV